ncbi:MAG: indole-3-glycerol phosphate synthase TrpC [Desulfosporosinus sp.]
MESHILSSIMLQRRQRLNQAQERCPLGQLWRQLEKAPSFLRRGWPLSTESFEVIAEVKRASPSLGPIPWDISLTDLVQAYQDGGAGVVSVLTEEDFFHGSLADLKQVRETTELPILRKDFLWSEYQIVESRLNGADAVLLIMSLLDTELLKELLSLAEELGLETLVECRDREEVEQALIGGAKTIGINNRDLRTFEVRLEKTLELSRLIPAECVVVSESGIKTSEDVERLATAGVNAILVGESFLRSSDPAGYIARLKDEGQLKMKRRSPHGSS